MPHRRREPNENAHRSPAPIGAPPGRRTAGSPALTGALGGGLGATGLLALQRTAGNAAVAGLIRRPRPGPAPVGTMSGRGAPVLQRRLSGWSKIQQLDVGDADLQALGVAIHTYNQAAGHRGNAQELTACFGALRTVERRAYRWIDAHATGPRLLDDDRKVRRLQRLVAEAEAEHENLIDEAKDIDGVVPADTTGMTPEEKAALKALWRDLVAGRGKIKRIGDQAFNRRALAELAKLIDTPTGRRLLGYLNAPKDPREDPASIEAKLSNVYLGSRPDQLPPEVLEASPSLKDVDRSEAQPLNLDDVIRKAETVVNVTQAPLGDHEHLDPTEFPTVSSSADLVRIRDAAWSGGKGFVFEKNDGGEKVKFTFNPTGTGAFVTSLPGRAMMAGRDDRQILAPGWVTLGHELGHAANFRAGASTIDEKAGFGPDTLTGRLTQGPLRGETRWDNAEEMLNIENVENAIRREAGLSERDSHRPPDFLTARVLAEKKRLMSRLGTLADNCQPADGRLLTDHHQPFKTLLAALRKAGVKDLADRAAVAAWRQRVQDYLDLYAVGPPADPRPSSLLDAWFASRRGGAWTK